jgi:hypothetical protein
VTDPECDYSCEELWRVVLSPISAEIVCDLRLGLRSVKCCWYRTFVNSWCREQGFLIVKAFPEFSLLLISSCMQFWFVSVVPRYLNFATLSKDLFAIFMLCLCPAFWHLDINIYLVFSEFTSKPTSLLASNRASVFFCVVSVFSQNINVISIG